jgi:hypothetical protein
MVSRHRLPERFAFASRAVRHRRFRRRPVLEVLEGRALLATFNVNSLGTLGSGSADSGDLLYCINQANADNQANTIVFNSTLFSTPQTINSGPLELSDTGGTQTITGPAAGVTIGVSPTGLQVDAGVTASISGLTLVGGLGVGSSGHGYGGALANYGTATLTGCTISSSGVFNSSMGNLTLADCTQHGNDAVGVSNSGTANLTDCTVSGNSAEVGAGLNNYGTAKLTGCTVSGNSATLEGGGLASDGSGPANLIDTIVAGNTETSGASDIGGSDVSGSDNLIGTGGSGGLVSGVDGNIVLTSLTDLGLAPLGKNGGPTQTMALLPGSPAIAAGVLADDPGTTTPITTDQRGEPLDSPDPDIGAYQTQGSTLATLSFSGISDQSITYGTSNVTISGTLADGSQAPVGETVAVTLDGVKQSPTIGSGGTFSTTFDTTGLTVADSPYTITYAYTTDGTFASASTTSTRTVNPATLTITANPETKVYGTADPALAYAVSGFQFSDTAATAVTGSPARAAGETVAGGPYAITQGTLAADGNYMIQFTGSTLTITPATPPVTVTALGGTYTGAPIAAAATVPGLGGTATPDLEGVTPTLTYYAGSGTAGTNLGSMPPSAAGTYTVVARFPGSADYAANQSKAATFTISPARATIVLEPHAVLKRKKTLKRVELTAAIQPVAPGGGMPTGQVTFEFLKKHGKKLKVTTLGTVELHGGEATLTFKPIQVLNKPLTIVYSGDPDFLASMLSPPKLTKKTLV